MSFWLKLKQTVDRVEYLLMNYPHLRDNDNRLVSNVWYNEAKDLIDDDHLMEGAEKFLELLAQGKFTPSKSIERCARKLKEKNPDLQGKNHRIRKANEKEVRKNIKHL